MRDPRCGHATHDCYTIASLCENATQGHGQSYWTVVEAAELVHVQVPPPPRHPAVTRLPDSPKV